MQLFDSVNIYPPGSGFWNIFQNPRNFGSGFWGKKKIGIEQTLILVFEKNKNKNQMQRKELPLHIEYTLKCLPQWVLVKFYWVLETPQTKIK